MHAEVVIDDSIVMLGEPRSPTEAVPAMLYVYVKDVDATYARRLPPEGLPSRLPRSSSAAIETRASATPRQPVWMATHLEDVPPDELARRTAAQRPS